MSWSTPGFAEIAGLITDRSGLAFPAARCAFAEAGIKRAMTRARSRDASEYLDLASSDAACFAALVSEIAVGETYFLRDGPQFDFIRTVALPDIANRATSIRVWSAGSSTGEEAYSLAIILEESGLAARSEISATDISPVSIAAARLGKYGEWSFREVDSMWRTRYFRGAGKGCWEIVERFPPRVSFQVGNLLDAPPTGGFDLILCRNVLMYFESRIVKRVMSLLVASLRDGGWLLTSASDPILHKIDGLEIITTPAGLAYRRAAHSDVAQSDVAHAQPSEPAAPSAAQRTPPRRKPLRPLVVVVNKRSEPVESRDEQLDPERYLREAMRLLDEDRASEAAIAARRAIFLDPKSGLGHLLIGRAFRLDGRISAAKRALQRARSLDESAGEGFGAAVEAELALLERASAEATT